jgi:hypothetical protein
MPRVFEHLKKHQIKKGEVRNPRGAAAHDPALRAIRACTKEELRDVANLILADDFQGLKDLAEAMKSTDKKPKGITVLKAMVASVALKIISKGDMYALDVLLNRLIGKVKDEVLLTGDGNPFQMIIKDYREKE